MNEILYKQKNNKEISEDIKSLDVRYNFIDSNISFNFDVLNLIKTGSVKIEENLEKKGQFFYNGPLLRFENLVFKDNKFTINVSDSIMYFDVIGLRFWNYEKYKNYESFELPNALSVFNFIITNDDKIIIQKRGNTGDWEVGFEIPGGFVRTSEKSLFESSQNRLFEDFEFIKKENILSQKFISIFDYKKITETPTIVEVKINLDSKSKLLNSENIFFVENSILGLNSLKEKFVNFHIPSIKAIEEYKKIFQKNDKN